ncbi:MAG: 7,8-didemethyl-8-hydroxy-5-deazariboflavin synthase subunit CofH [Chloroflexi bacterium]|nr:7,8-didemethyl-8-hydroxy-5-deazariboflavin synthase subunit CofH [Chloroflexota bacterium]
MNWEPERQVTFSRSITVVPTHTCHKLCGYCEFRQSTPQLLTWEDAQAILSRGRAFGCREALVMSGEKPWLMPGFPLDEEAFIDYVYRICLEALRLGMLPHTNIGVLAYEQQRKLKEVNVSMGLMLETTNDTLVPAHNDWGGRWARKQVAERLEHMEIAGSLRIPFTTGLLIGIGESSEDRRESLLAIKAIQERYGHIQEVIIQNFIPKPGTTMAQWPEPTEEEMTEVVRLARELLPSSVAVQIPPNLNSDFERLVRAGASDFGGISPEVDEVSPTYRWPSVEETDQRLKSIGYILKERLPVYPDVEADLQPAADAMRRELKGDVVTYVVNRNLNFTNVCIGGCRFCAFKKSYKQGEAYLRTFDEALERVEWGVSEGATEVCIQGGLNPDVAIDYYLKFIYNIKKRFPFLHIHAYSPEEVRFMSLQSGWSIRDVLAALKDHGLGSMPGTAAEILVEEVRQIICPQKLTVAEWEEVTRTAHKLGIPTTSTIMFGHVENWSHRVRHMEVIRNIQLDTGGFTEFVLLPFIPFNTTLGRGYKIKPLPMLEILKVAAYARLFFGKDIPNIQTSWPKMGVEGVKASLSWGANDFGGTLMEENISREAGASHGQYLRREAIEEAIRSVGRIPAERTTLYGIRRIGAGPGEAPIAQPKVPGDKLWLPLHPVDQPAYLAGV